MNDAMDRMTTWLGEVLKTPHDWLVQSLRTLLGPLDAWLTSLSTETGRWCAVALFAIAMLWVLTLRRDFIFRGAPGQSIWYDLRLWTLAALTPYVLIYMFLF